MSGGLTPRPCCYFGTAVLAITLLSPGVLAAQTRVVNFYNWSDYMAPTVLDDFSKSTGIKVRYETFDSNDTLETKLLAGKSGYDLVVPTGYFLERQIKAGIFLKLDAAKLPNLTYVWPEIANRLATYDPGNQYAVNYMWGTTGIGYNVNKARERLGADVKIDSWDMVFKPENLAKFKDCGVYMLDSSDDILTAALRYLGLNPNTTDPADYDKAADLVDEDQAVGPQVPFVRISQRTCYRRDLLRRWLVRRHQAGTEARRRGEERRRHRIRYSPGRRTNVVRQSGGSKGRQERRRGARTDQLFACARCCRQEQQLPVIRERR